MRVLALCTAAFSTGIFLAQYLLPERLLLPGALACFALSCAALTLHAAWRRRAVLACLALSLALGYNWLYLRQIYAPMEALADTEGQAVMTLLDYAQETSRGAKVTVHLSGLPGRAVYYGETALLDCRPGQTVEDRVAFQSAAHIRDADVTTFTSKGVFLLAYQRGTPIYGGESADGMRWWPRRLYRAMQTRIDALFDGDAAAFLTAMLTGDKSGLSQQASSDLSEAGLYHILAVSGMHCGFLLALAVLLTGRHRRRLTAAMALPLLAFYALLTGASPSVVRACVMLAFLLLAPLFRRDSDPPTALAAALGLILLQNPFAAASISLQLSFGAVAGILFFTPRLYCLLAGNGRHGRLLRVVSASVSATLGALVFTAPLCVWYFGSLVLVSPISNLLCLWAASLVFLLGLPAVLVSFFLPAAGALLAVLPRLLIGYILLAAHLLARIPYHALYAVNPYLKYWLVYGYLLFGLAWMGKPKAPRKYVLAAVLAAASLACTAALGVPRYTAGDLDAVVLDVGQGESVALSSGQAFALVDCGSSNRWYDSGGIAADQLDTMGCGALDYLILTHYDSDHVCGVTALLARTKVNRLLVPDSDDNAGLRETVLSAARNAGTEVVFIQEESVYSFGDGTLSVYPPLGETGDNEKGLTILASCGGQDLLITGDMDSATEEKLLTAYDLPDIEALVVGHHGSKYSTSQALLETLRPETAVISVGANSYGHPTDETLRRLREADCAIYRTDLQGNIHLILNRGA